MTFLKKSIPLFLCFAITSCTGQPKTKLDTAKKASFTLNNFMNIPSDIDGCSCYFYASKLTFKNNEFIFVADFQGAAFLSINNTLQKFKIKKSGREANTFGDYDHTDIYENDLYKVTIKIKYLKSNGEETWLNEGTITIINKAGEKLIKSFYGECGC